MEDYKRTTHSAHLKELDELRASHAAVLNRLAEEERENARKHQILIDELNGKLGKANKDSHREKEELTTLLDSSIKDLQGSWDSALKCGGSETDDLKRSHADQLSKF
jgi:hypothetical protein